MTETNDPRSLERRPAPYKEAPGIMKAMLDLSGFVDAVGRPPMDAWRPGRRPQNATLRAEVAVNLPAWLPNAAQVCASIVISSPPHGS